MFYLAPLFTLKMVLSAQKVPKGITDTARARNVVLAFHFSLPAIKRTVIMYKMNKKPWL